MKFLTPATDPNDWPAWLKVPDDLETVFRRSQRTIYRLVKHGVFGPVTPIGGARYVARKTVLKALDERTVDLRPPRRQRRRKQLTRRHGPRRGGGRV